MKASSSTLAGVVILVLVITEPAAAYVGPGAGLTVLGGILAVVASLFLAIMGFVWYPIRRVLRNRKKKAESVESLEGEPGAPEQPKK
ncbi:hypothetical protein [Rhodothalassium salexigens]|uniref:hypothetical protein n=1 Tax=Rhodothalassium salexigens TaxID=1086 RepID=UPI0019113BF6|nr:hypothetical protein [Rhodothalassium salexigens]